jgi:hypothetical protein
MSDTHPAHHQAIISGKIIHVFNHRFVVQTARGAILADLTPQGLDQVSIHPGDDVSLEGEQKPSELKVARFTRDGKTVHIEHRKKHHGKDHPPADPAIVLKSARTAGFEPIGEPRRKPRHFEVLGRRRGEVFELHIDLDGHIRKTKRGASEDHNSGPDLSRVPQGRPLLEKT